MVEQRFVFSVRDPHCRVIQLGEERLEHILYAHPELDDRRLVSLLIEAVQQPYEIHYGYGPGEEWRYVKGGPSRWVKVVIVFGEERRGRIITAFPRRRKP